MYIPKREKKPKEDILEYIQKCAKQYVPEWRYDPEEPDAGAALVSLFADMTADTINRFNLSAAGDMLSFFDEMHAKRLPAKPAEGFITFGLPEGFDGEEEVSRGIKLLADTEGEPVVFETQEEVLVRQMEIQKIYLSNPLEDAIFQVFDREQEEMPSFFLFQNQGENLQRHRICFCFERGLEIRTCAEAEFSFQVAESTIEPQEWKRAILEEKGIRFSYSTAQGYRYISDHGFENQDTALRFEIVGGENGIAVKEKFDSCYVIQAEISDAAFFSGIWLSSPRLSLKGRNKKPDFIHVNGVDQELEDFLVFGRTPSVYDEFYIASDEVFGKVGAEIQVEFDLDFVKLPIELAMEEKISWKAIMKKRDFVPEQEYDITIHEVVWEYYNGYGWTRLPEGYGYRTLFAVKENREGQRIKMQFTCPSDIQRVLVNSAETYAIRARILRMNNAYKTRGAYIAPVAGRVQLSYDYSKAPLAPSRIVKWNHLEEQSFAKETLEQKGFSVSFCDKNPDQKKTCYFGFAKPLMDGPLKFLFVMHDTMRQNMPAIEWEYLGMDGWESLHVVDGTKGFHHTGIISWFGRREITRSTLFGQNLFWIRFRDAKGAYEGQNQNMQCPKVEGIYPNSTRILGVETVEEFYGLPPHAQEKQIQLPNTNIADLKVWVLEREEYRQGFSRPVWELWQEVEELDEHGGTRREYSIDRQTGCITFPRYMEVSCLNEQEEIAVHVRYEHCQGSRGNLGAGAINRMNRSIGFISSCYNPVASSGGTDQEKTLEAIRRNAQILRHGSRCVSARDYEDMAWEATRNIRKVKCFSGYDLDGKRKPGVVTLVVLPKEYEEPSSSFEKTQMQILEYFSKHMDENMLYLGRFHIIRPEMVRLDVSTSIELLGEKELFLVRKRVLEELERFLHPLEGNFYGEGWDIGVLPNTNQITHALKRVEGVRHVGQMKLRKFVQGRFEEMEVHEESALPYYLLPKSGIHDIRMI